MFNLPNRPKLTGEEITSRAKLLAKEYSIALEKEDVRNEKRPIIERLLQTLKTIAHARIDRAPEEAGDELVQNLYTRLEDVQVEIARALVKRAPQEAGAGLAKNLVLLPEDVRVEIARALVKRAPREAGAGLAWNLGSLPDDNVQVEVAWALIDQAPQEAGAGLAKNLGFLPEDVQVEIARALVERAPREAGDELVQNLYTLPEDVRVEVAWALIDQAPQEAGAGLAKNLGFLPEDVQVEIARALVERAPREAGDELVRNINFLPEAVRKEIKNTLMSARREKERERLLQFEEKNPILYKEVDDSGTEFFRSEFQKTGTRTLLLGQTLVNNAIVRIIPNRAFIGWMEAYSAVETWREAGFDYVPIEPIIKARVSSDGKYTRVYAGVLGISVGEYLKMHINEEHHDNVMDQQKLIKETLGKMRIRHGHLHDYNFCVLHERTPDGKIDWNEPPRVYAIDFDAATSSG